MTSFAPRRAALRRIASLAAAAAVAMGGWSGRADPPVPAALAPPAPIPERSRVNLAAGTAAGYLALGARLTERGDYPTAESALRMVIARTDFSLSDQKTALLALAHLYRKAGKLTKAVSIYEKYLAEFPDDPRVPDAFLDLGRTLRDMGAYKLALTRFYSVINTTLKVTTQDFDHYSLLAKTAQFEIAQTYYEAGDYVEAGKYFNRVKLLELAPSDLARAYFMAGCAEQRAGEIDDAIATLKTYLAQWPADENVPEARYVLATALQDRGKPQEALAVTLALLHAEQSLVASNPRRWNYWQRRTGNQVANQFFQAGDCLDALALYRSLAGLSSDPAWRLPITYQVALCYERLYQIDAARTAYQTVIDGAKAAGASPVVTELGAMAAWRMRHIEWSDDANRRLMKIFSQGLAGPPAPTSDAKSDSSTPASS